MDQNTTNINDLPIDNNPPEDRELPESNLNMNRSRVIEESTPTPKKVHFEEKKIVKTQLYEISETNKIIILASLFFLLFSDLKVKSYVLNILIIFFGNSLKTATGGISKIGLVIYSLVYGVALLAFVNVLETAIARFS
jgi:hypothetical protein